jgi:hypothetical protein
MFASSRLINPDVGLVAMPALSVPVLESTMYPIYPGIEAASALRSAGVIG